MDFNDLKSKLESEREKLITELQGIARVKPENPNDWDTFAEEMPLDSRDEVAERMESENERKAEEVTLEKQLLKVRQALARLDDGTYGVCLICQQKIEPERLEAAPTATTCKNHRQLENH